MIIKKNDRREWGKDNGRRIRNDIDIFAHRTLICSGHWAGLETYPLQEATYTLMSYVEDDKLFPFLSTPNL